MKGRRAARAPGGREREGGRHARTARAGSAHAAPRPRPRPRRRPRRRCRRRRPRAVAATGTAERVPTASAPGPGSGLPLRGPGSSGMGAAGGTGAPAWALSSSRAGRAERLQPERGPGCRVPNPTLAAPPSGPTARPQPSPWPRGPLA